MKLFLKEKLLYLNPIIFIFISLLTDGDAEDVGLQLHQQPVGRHSSVHLQLRQGDAAVLVHRLQDLKDAGKSEESVE